MLNVLRQGQRWIMLGVIIVVGGVFVLFTGLGKPLVRASDGVVVAVAGREFGPREVLRVRSQQEEEFRRTLGSAFDPKTAASQLDAIAANTVAQRAILSVEAERIGLRASEDELRETIRNIGIFRDESGSFSRDRFRTFVEYEYGTERLFLQALRDDLLAQKLARLIGSSAEVSQAEAREALGQRLEQVELAIVPLDASKAPEGFDATPEAVQDLLTKAEPRMRAAYDQQADRYRQPERAHARHILVKVGKDAPEAEVDAARAKLVAARDRIAQGADFAQVAGEVSEDPGSKDKGGDLGFFQRGQMVPAFEEVAFSIELATLSEPVRTDFGWHIVRVEERQPAQNRAFEEVREELAREALGQDAARARARADADQLLEAVRGGGSLENAARDMKLAIQRPGPMTRRPDGFVVGLGLAPDLMNAVFAAPADAKSLPRVFELGDRLVMVEILERRTPDADRIAKELPAEVDRLRQEKRQRLQLAWIDARRETLIAEGRYKIDPTALDKAPAR
jgi:peptidyl-prolyl cis-trans isomerase D